MCGRYMITSPFEAMARLFEAAPSELGPDVPRPNVSPTQKVPVAVSHEGDRVLAPMRWGFVPHWYKTPNDGPLLFNARAETIAEKPAFRAAARERRCLIPADGFYEWTGEKGAKVAHVIRPRAGGLLAFVSQEYLVLCLAAVLCGTGANTGMIAIQRSAGRLAASATDRIRVFSWLGSLSSRASSQRLTR